jgi:hypothetical protein
MNRIADSVWDITVSGSHLPPTDMQRRAVHDNG